MHADDGLDTQLELNHNEAGALIVDTLDVKDVHTPPVFHNPATADEFVTALPQPCVMVVTTPPTLVHCRIDGPTDPDKVEFATTTTW